MTILSTKQKQFLKGLAHHLSPVVMLGGNGLTEGVLAEIDNALNHHELIKVKIAGADRETKHLTFKLSDIFWFFIDQAKKAKYSCLVNNCYPLNLRGCFLDVINFNNLELNRSTWCGNIHGIIQLFSHQSTSNR